MKSAKRQSEKLLQTSGDDMKLLFHNRSLFLVLALLLPLASVQAHESRPAYLEIKQISDSRYNVLWRTPVNSGMRLPLVLRFPDEVRNVTEPRVQELNDSLIERRLIEVINGLV